jgi:signal transduction histidine kinase
VQETAQLLSVSIGKNATLKYELASALPAVNGDPTQLQQVAMNLINNAVEALDGKEGAVTVSTGVRDCDAAYLSDALIGEILPAGRYAYLEVTDTGCGMTEETRLRICDPFFTTKPTGHGMGLAAVVGVVRGHMGAMRIVSKVGEGSTFTVLFPIGHADGQPV